MKEKYLEFYLDSKTYSPEQMLENIEKEKRQYPKKDIAVEIALNKWGIYVITMKFKEKEKNKIIKQGLKEKVKKTQIS